MATGLWLGGNRPPYLQTSLTSTRLTSDLQNTPTSSKLSLPGYRQLTPISITPKYKPWCQGGTNASMSMVTRWRSDVYHLLPMCRAYTEVSTKALGIRLLPYFLHFLVNGIWHASHKICMNRVRLVFWSCILSTQTIRHSFIHSVFCLTTGPKPPPKRCLHLVRSRASSFK